MVSEGLRLLETMKLADHGVVPLLDRHLQRLRNSATQLGFDCDPAKLREIVIAAAAKEQKPARVRLLLSRDGGCDLEFGAVSAADLPLRLQLSGIRVDSSNIWLYHKNTHRQVYASAREGCAKDSDVILINERGEATETTIANIAVWRAGRWITPLVSCGLLPGVMRAELLSAGELTEGIVPADSLREGETIRCFNAVRGIFDLPFTARPERSTSG
jgi:para-aminobenzoate synthetase/4-amino-4-deoxychorismate lyase